MSTSPSFRIHGLDLARSLAIIGMIQVNFQLVLGQQGSPWLEIFTSFLTGKASATFVVLAGAGLSVMTRTAQGNPKEWKKARLLLIKRSLFLFVAGLSYLWIWPADILHFYGVYILLSLSFLRLKPRVSLVAATFIILLYPVLLGFFDYSQAWDFAKLEYRDFWSLRGFVRNLFLNGFHPVIPWISFLLVGIWFGRQRLNNRVFIKFCLVINAVGFILIQLLSLAVIRAMLSLDVMDAETSQLLFGTASMPPLPMYMLNGITFALALISACILVSQKLRDNPVIAALSKTGRMALTFYVLHVILGMGLIEALGPHNLGKYTLEFSTTYALIFSLFCILFAVVWLRYFRIGPLEWMMRKLTG